ncbi:hypothetical protein ACLOJK_035090, partial [Asimina triloba]
IRQAARSAPPLSRSTASLHQFWLVFLKSGENPPLILLSLSSQKKTISIAGDEPPLMIKIHCRKPSQSPSVENLSRTSLLFSFLRSGVLLTRIQNAARACRIRTTVV